MKTEFEWFNDSIERYEERLVTIKLLKNELAFHEASHFVFNCLALKHLDGFLPLYFIISCAEKSHEEGYNTVNGFAPNLPYRKKINEEQPQGYLEFYNSDIKRLVAQLISLTAGYASYQVFMKYMSTEDYFIGCSLKPLPSENLQLMKYYRKEYALSSTASDFIKISDNLRIYYNQNSEEVAEATIKLIEIVQKLMMIPAINHSIRFVKNKLLRNQCIRIEGNHLEGIIKEVNRLTNKIPFKSVLEQYVNEI